MKSKQTLKLARLTGSLFVAAAILTTTAFAAEPPVNDKTEGTAATIHKDPGVTVKADGDGTAQVDKHEKNAVEDGDVNSMVMDKDGNAVVEDDDGNSETVDE